MADAPITSRPELELDEGIQTEHQKQTYERIKALGFSAAADDTKPPPLTLTERRLEEITNIMRHGEWERGKTDGALSKLWGIDPSQVRRLAAEAGRSIRREINETLEDREGLLADIRASFARLAVKAEKIGTAQALKVAMDGIDKLADYTGLKPALKVDTGKDPFAGWTDEELLLFTQTGQKPKHAK